MSEEKKDDIIEEKEEKSPKFFRSRYPGYHGYDWHRRDHLMRQRMWMNFAYMSLEEEVKLLESVKGRLEKRLEMINERLTKLKS